MEKKKLDHLVLTMENFLECWKKMNGFITLARSKKFTEEDESEFLETKSVIVQELEEILSKLAVEQPSREDVHQLLGLTPSLRYISDAQEGVVRGVENNWHRIFIGFQSLLGQLKVQQRSSENTGGWLSFFKKKK